MPRPDRVFRTEAIILRGWDFLEADRMLTIYTPEHGKLRGIAKGVRKPTARMTGHVELFSRASLLLARGQELFTISQAEQIDPHLPLHDNLSRGAYAHYIVELLDRFSEVEEPNPPLYNLLSVALGWLTAPDTDLALVGRFFELRLLGLVGFKPVLFECAAGQEPLEPQDQFFSVMDGGVVCPEHVRGRAVMPLSLTALKMLRYMQTRDYETVSRVRVSEGLHMELERILQTYTVHLLEMRLKSADFIRLLRRHE